MLRRALVFVSIAGLTSCGVEPSGPRDTGGHSDCAVGFLHDGGGCVPEACGMGTWGLLEVDEATVFVDISAPAGGDGGEAAPLASIQPALDLAGSRGGGLVAVAAGTYPETLSFTAEHAGVHLAGRCWELVTLDASVGDESTAGIEVGVLYGEAELSGLGVVGSRYAGLLATSGAVRLREVMVRESANTGIWAARRSAASVTLELRDCLVVANGTRGISAEDPGTVVALIDTTIRDTQPGESGGLGYGVEVHSGAELTAQGCALQNNTLVGVLVTFVGSEVTLVDTVVCDTWPDEREDHGVGIAAQSGGVLTVEGCVIEGNSRAGLMAEDEGTEVSVTDTTIRDTLADRSAWGSGLEVTGGATLTARRCVLEGNTALGLWVDGAGSDLSMVDTTVRDTRPRENGQYGFGVQASLGATLRAQGCLVESNAKVGIAATKVGTEVWLAETSIRDTLPDAHFDGGHAIQVTDGAMVAARSCSLEDCTRIGIAASGAGTEISLVDSTVRETQPGGGGEGGYAIQVSDGARLSVRGCALADNTTAGILLGDPGTTATIRGSSITGTGASSDRLGATALGLISQNGATVSASELLVRDNEGPGLYAEDEGQLVCTDCALLDNRFAGAATVNGGVLELWSSTITGTREGADLGGGVGVFAAQQVDWAPPTLLVRDCTITDNPVAGAWIAREGSYRFEGNTFASSSGVSHGVTTRCGDGVYAADIGAWDDGSGLWLSGNTLRDNVGAGLFLDNAAALLDGNTWEGNDPDLLVQGEACTTPPEDWADAPTSEICPAWDRPSCELLFHLNLTTETIDPARQQPCALPILDAPTRPAAGYDAGRAARM